MKAVIQQKYGEPAELTIQQVDKPTPKDDQVLVRVHASSINFANVAITKGKPFMVRFWSGLGKPKFQIPGGDIAGTVEAVGRNVKQFKPGDRVYADSGDHEFGAFAEYVAITEKLSAPMPKNLNFDEAGTMPQAADVALQAIRNKGKIQAGQHVLVYGASGGIGTFCVQLAKAHGATVTAVCSGKNIDMIKSLGADKVIDYTKEDFLDSGENYDLILATAGYRHIADYKKALTDTGIYVATGGDMKQIMQANLLGSFYSEKNGKTLCALAHKPRMEDLLVLAELAEAGKIKPYIDKTFSLEEISQAMQYYDLGHTRGKIVIHIQ